MKLRNFAGFFALLFLNFSALLGQKKSPLEIKHLTGDFYIYTTYHMLESGIFPANGMYLVTKDGAVVFDTPWDTTQFQPLLDSIQARHGKSVVLCLATHSHADRTAGLDFYKKQGIRTYTSKYTDQLLKAENKKRAEFYFEKDTVFTVGEYAFSAIYPGEGHTKDNIVAWFEKEKILYGGCLIKSTESEDLGYIEEGNVDAWPATIEYLQQRCQNPRFIIPGHQSWTSTKSLKYTLKLLRKYKKEQQHAK